MCLTNPGEALPRFVGVSRPTHALTRTQQRRNPAHLPSDHARVQRGHHRRRTGDPSGRHRQDGAPVQRTHAAAVRPGCGAQGRAGRGRRVRHRPGTGRGHQPDRGGTAVGRPSGSARRRDAQSSSHSAKAHRGHRRRHAARGWGRRVAARRDRRRPRRCHRRRLRRKAAAPPRGVPHVGAASRRRRGGLDQCRHARHHRGDDLARTRHPRRALRRRRHPDRRDRERHRASRARLRWLALPHE